MSEKNKKRLCKFCVYYDRERICSLPASECLYAPNRPNYTRLVEFDELPSDLKTLIRERAKDMVKITKIIDVDLEDFEMSEGQVVDVVFMAEEGYATMLENVQFRGTENFGNYTAGFFKFLSNDGHELVYIASARMVKIVPKF
jgi:hypothetical protein